MDVTPRISRSAQVVESYTDGAVRVSGTTYEGPVWIEPTCVRPLPADVGQNLPPLEKIDLVLVGETGEGAGSLAQTLRTRGISVEKMDRGAACRTYNALMAEGRRVALLLI